MDNQHDHSFPVQRIEHSDNSLADIVESEVELFVASYDHPFDEAIEKTKFLFDAIGPERFMELFEDAMRSQIDIARPDHARFLSHVALACGSRVIGMFEVKKIHWINHDHQKILNGIAQSGKEGANWVLANFEKRLLDPMADHDLIIELISNAGPQPVIERLNTAELQLESTTTLNIVALIILEHMGEWVKSFFGDRLDIDNDLHVAYFCEFVEAGEGEWVKSRLEPHGIILGDPWMPLLENISNHGGAEWVTKRVIPSTLADWPKLLSSLTRNGQAAWVHHYFPDGQTPASHEAHWRLKFDEHHEFPSFSPENIEYVRSSMEERHRDKKSALIKDFNGKLSDLKIACDLEEETIEEIALRITAIINAFPASAHPFLELVLEQHGFFSCKTLSALEALTDDGTTVALKMYKTGSELTLRIRPLRNAANPETQRYSVAFVHAIPHKSAEAWVMALEQEIPVAPIIKGPSRIGSSSSSRVMSRYCGMPLAFYDSLDIPPLSAVLFKMKSDLLLALKAQGIDHGHPHDSNFTVEFAETQWLDDQLAHGATINTLPPDAQELTFDPVQFLNNPTTYTPIVRLIDWDEASIENRV